MTRRSATSFLVRLEATDNDTNEGTVTSVRTGVRTPFGSLAALVGILEAWHEADPPRQQEEETR